DRLERRGPTMLWAVAGYGLATVVFGISRSFWVTFFCLALTGATDTVSMIIRNIIRQLETPDRLRGRMMGVNMVFFQGGPQLGELEAGAVANWLGAPFSVISGGLRRPFAPGWGAGSPLPAPAGNGEDGVNGWTQRNGGTETNNREDRLVFFSVASLLLRFSC